MIVGEANVNSVRYAENTVLIADAQEKLRELLNALEKICVERGMENNISLGKTEVLGLTKRSEHLIMSIMLNGRAIPQVEKLKKII